MAQSIGVCSLPAASVLAFGKIVFQGEPVRILPLICSGFANNPANRLQRKQSPQRQRLRNHAGCSNLARRLREARKSFRHRWKCAPRSSPRAARSAVAGTSRALQAARPAAQEYAPAWTPTPAPVLGEVPVPRIAPFLHQWPGGTDDRLIVICRRPGHQSGVPVMQTDVATTKTPASPGSRRLNADALPGLCPGQPLHPLGLLPWASPAPRPWTPSKRTAPATVK